MRGTQQLLTLAEAYAVTEGIELTTVSSRIFNDGKKLNAIKAGADLYSGRLEAAIRWFDDRWPVGLDWPAGIARPSLDLPPNSAPLPAAAHP